MNDPSLKSSFQASFNRLSNNSKVSSRKVCENCDSTQCHCSGVSHRRTHSRDDPRQTEVIRGGSKKAQKRGESEAVDSGK